MGFDPGFQRPTCLARVKSSDRTKQSVCGWQYIYIYHVLPPARISLTLSRHSSLSFIASGRSSGLHPVSSHSCCMQAGDGRPAFARPYEGCHRRTSLMSLFLLIQQCPACLARLTDIYIYIYIYIYSVTEKWVHPSHFCRYLSIFLHGTTLTKWHFDTMRSSLCAAYIKELIYFPSK